MVSAVEPGRLVVLSSLGEPLRAEIDFAQQSGERAVPVMQLAPAEAYAAAGLRYDPALAAARLRFDIRPDGRYFYTLQTARAITQTSLALLFELEAPPPRKVRRYQLLLDPQIAPGSTQFYPAVIVSRAPVARSTASASAPAAAIPEREIARLQSQIDAQGKSLAAMLERVAAMEKAVKDLQRQLGAPAAAPGAKSAADAPKPATEKAVAPPPAAEKPAPEKKATDKPAVEKAESATAPPAAAPAAPAAPAPAAKPAAPPPAKTPSAAAAELAERQARSDSWLNHSLLILAGGLLVMLIGIGGWMFYGPPSKEAAKVKAGKKADKAQAQ